VTGRLVELDEDNARAARTGLAEHGLAGVEVLQADAGTTDAYAGAVPADVVLLCGVLGNISDADIERTLLALPALCRPGGTVLWTRHRREPDLTPAARGWLARAGFEEVAFLAPPGAGYAVGSHRYAGPPVALEPGVRLFRFTR